MNTPDVEHMVNSIMADKAFWDDEGIDDDYREEDPH